MKQEKRKFYQEEALFAGQSIFAGEQIGDSKSPVWVDRQSGFFISRQESLMESLVGEKTNNLQVLRIKNRSICVILS